jgi:hypothetical protein
MTYLFFNHPNKLSIFYKMNPIFRIFKFYLLRSLTLKRIFQLIFLLTAPLFSYGEGSSNWGTETNRQSMLYYPGSSGTGGFSSRGYMLLPSSVSGYNGGHRLYVYAKAGETVFWGFRRYGTGNVRVRWFYDAGSSDFFPVGTSGSSRTLHSFQEYAANGSTDAIGRPSSALSALNGPSQITGSGYQGYSFVNNTGAARAFWIEISNTSNNHITGGFNIDHWDITVASGSAGSYTEHTGRVYSRFWSIANSRLDPTVASLTLTKGAPDAYSFHNNFGFYVPVDNTYSTQTDDYFVKYINFGGSSGGWTNFFANKDGPRNDLTYEENRKSRPGTSSNFQYPLFVNNPDPSIWKSTAPPTASLIIDYEPKLPPEIGGEATVNLTISLPAVVDVLIDLNGNLSYDEGVDLIISEKYDAPGTYQIYWNGQDADGNVVPADSDVEVIATVVFFPVHFPIFDLEQSLGMRVTNIRPGSIANNSIFWDDSLIPRTGLTPSDSPQSLMVNTTGVLGPDHIWWASGDNGFSDNNTINTWAGSYNTEVQGSFRILPVQWLYFRGKSIENRVKLEWGTAQEKDNDKFILMRSKDGKSWSEISEVKGQGNSEKPVYYYGWDPSPMVGPNYYRLKQLDYNGKDEFTSVIKVEFIPDWEIHLYPNPVIDELFIQTKNVNKFEVVLVDSNGTIIPLQSKLINQDKMVFDIRNIRAGMYMVYIYGDDKKLVKKLIKTDH